MNIHTTRSKVKTKVLPYIQDFTYIFYATSLRVRTPQTLNPLAYNIYENVDCETLQKKDAGDFDAL